MPEFINLHRHFRELNKKELTASDELPSWSAWLGRESPLDWSAILQWQRVLLLVEAGSGKTAEMQAQASAPVLPYRIVLRVVNRFVQD